MPISPLLELRNISVSYGCVSAVRNVSLEVGAGEIHAIVGETASGKSTLARSIIGISDGRTTSGQVLFEGRDLGTCNPEEWRRIRGCKIGIVFQKARASLNPVLTIEDHLVETLRSHQKLSRREALEKARAVVGDVGLGPEVGRRYAFELSGGACQRVGVALGICNNPRLLIADEPTSSIDPASQEKIIVLLEELRSSGMSILLICHDLSLISRLADRVSVMYQGRIVESGSSREIAGSPAHPYTRSLLASRLSMEHHSEWNPVSAIDGAATGCEAEISGCAFSPRCSIALPQCSKELPEGRSVSETHVVSCFVGGGR